ncbi:MAG: hypothetical protein K2X29_04120 [Candidatus Obscuribacterales bacterium]|nr:hypothetical protein [Candidatus Obscuribacterales bacterium]
MEKIFSINKWFVFFCGFFVLIWLAQQTVINQRMIEIAKLQAQPIFSWQWQDMGWAEEADISEAKVLKLTKAEAKVRIVGRQKELVGSGVNDLAATLTFYREGRNWILGRVEFN